MAEVSRTGEEINEPIELDDADIIAAEPLSYTQGSPRATLGTITERLQTAGVDTKLLEVVRKKIAGLDSIDEATADEAGIDGMAGEARVRGLGPSGTITQETVDSIERRAIGVIFPADRARRDALKTPGQRAATEIAIQKLRRLSGKPPSSATGGEKTRKDKLIEDLQWMQNG